MDGSLKNHLHKSKFEELLKEPPIQCNGFGIFYKMVCLGKEPFREF